ncbi:MAG: peptidoglycan DD-metalloendopeptidase family protein [Deltaproteobacteria bacterium]|nr:peptidoglycan DD-metalloendopeptidase family protein [Deltaproteobacteria bacterium]
MSPLTITGLAPQALLASTPRGIEEQQRLARKSPLEIAREFEAILVAQIIGAMRKTVSSTGLFGGGDSGANKVLDGAFDQELARSIAKDAHLGLAEQLAAQIERHQHAAAAAGDAPHTQGTVDAVAASRPAVAEDGSAVRATATAAAEDDVATQLVAGAEGRVTSGFGVRRDPITGAPAFHGGIDVAAPRGSAIHAVASGEVTFSGRRGHAGNVVEVRDGDVVSTYAHVARALVRAGQKVAAGDVLATIGSTGRSTGPHVHFAMTRDGQAIDPAAIVQSTATVVVSPPGEPEEA